MTRQRWFANKGADPDLEVIGAFEFVADPDVRIVTHLVLDHTVGKPALYQVPVTYRSAPLLHATGLIGQLDGEYLYDGPHDPAYTGALLDFIAHAREVTGDRTWAMGHPTVHGAETDLVSRVLTGEQSNTSIIYESESAAGGGETSPVIIKLFRALHHGENPDVVLQTALAAAGSHTVPAPVGHIVGEWDDRGQASGRARGHLAFAQEFLPGVEDAWRVALRAAQGGEDFSDAARELGRATASMHATLATTMPTSAAAEADITTVIDSMQSRLRAAIDEVPALAIYAPGIHDLFASAAGATWPDQQRIHGDLHLGQVLKVPARGWVLVDFEGEPLRPMHERSELDSPLRDVAGMLRSFDYVAGSIAMTGGAPADDWAAAARTAFEAGYYEASGHDLSRVRGLLDAFELDKALYETVYEARNRPTWVEIPVMAIRRLSHRAP
jgi:trehalose synthase-fused probable maltokinase